MSEQQKGFAIAPKMDCPHLDDQHINQLLDFLLSKNQEHFSKFQCNQCKDTKQNWICLQCQTLGCSRYVKSHMAEHNASTKHPIALSFSDGSFWCYDCQSYIDSAKLKSARVQLSKSKFASQQEKPKEDLQQIIKQLEDLAISAEKELTYDKLITQFKNKSYKKVVFLTGAGLSVASGIPDFRSPKTGLYSQLAKYNLPYPQAVFEINFYKKNPEPFMKVAKQYLSGEYEPTLGHKFIKKLQDQNILEMVLTQNIDDLQTKAGIKQQKMLQAHGHGRSAHCIECGKEGSMQKWKEQLEKLERMDCKECKGLVKPDIVFFGQQLPKQFNQAPEIVKKADLVIIIGTSLAVVPFSYLGNMIQKSCPLVLINNEDSIAYRRDKLWLKGDIQENVQRIMKQLNWI